MNPTDILAAVQSHNWLVLVMLVALWARKLTSADSLFPVNIPPNWRPVILGVLAMVIAGDGALEAHRGVQAALLSALAAGGAGYVFDGLLTAIFGKASNAPTWAKALVFVVDDVAGKAAPATVAVPKDKGPQAGSVHVPALFMVAVVSLTLLLTGTFLTGCTPGAQAVVQDAGKLTLCVDGAVFASVEAGATTFEDIAAAIAQAGCGPIAMNEIEAIVALLQSKQPTGSPMASKLAAVHHKAAQ